MREIGSEFWDAPTNNQGNSLFSKSTQWFLSGRSALQAIIKDLKDCHTVALPSWCCDSMIKPFIDAGMEVRFYPVYYKQGLVQEINLESDVLFLMDYFGYTSRIPDLNDYKGIIIRDVTHSLFSYSFSDADYYFGSLRKWCGVWTGGYAWTKDGHKLLEGKDIDNDYVSLRKQAMSQKNEYIRGFRDDKGYLNIFSEAEDILDCVGIVPAVNRDVELAYKLNVEGIKNKRRTNAEILRKAFSNWLVFPEMKNDDCPMFVPIIVPGQKRNELKEYLIKNEIYCPVHWPLSAYHKLNESEKFIYKNELSLVCDQRYTNEDMNRMVDSINEFFKEV